MAEMDGRYYYKLDTETMSMCYISFDKIKVGDLVMHVDRSTDKADETLIVASPLFMVNDKHVDIKNPDLSFLRVDERVPYPTYATKIKAN